MTSINYFDFGLAANPTELIWTESILRSITGDYQCHGFEAFPDYYNSCAKIINSKGLKNTHLHNLAISDSEKEIKLYLSNNNVGHSIFETKNNVDRNKFVRVRAVRFSEFLRQQDINLSDSFNVVKMNIEGAEWHLINDLINEDLIGDIHVWCGAGHDIVKISELHSKLEEWERIIKEHKIDVHRWSGWKPHRNADVKKIIVDGHKNWLRSR